MADSFETSRPADLTRLPPYSQEAEQGVLGCILLAPVEGMELVCDRGVAPATFYHMPHRSLFEALLEMSAAGQAIDMLTFVQRLTDHGLIDLVGGLAYISGLLDKVPSAVNLEYYVEMIMEKWTFRKLISTATDIITQSYAGIESAETVLATAEQRILAIRPAQSIAAALEPMALAQAALSAIELEWNSHGQITGLRAGLPDLDHMTAGLHPGEVTVIAAFPGMGKTSIAMNIAESVLLDQHRSVGIFSLEMSAVQLVKRFIASHAKVNMHNVRLGTLLESDFPRIQAAGMAIGHSCIRIDDRSDLSIYQLRAAARRMHHQHHIELLIIDYLQLMTAIGGPRKISNRQEEVAEISRGVKAISRELEIPVIVMSQLSDDGKLRESRAIGQDGDNELRLEYVDEKNTDGEIVAMKIHIKKQRNGPTGYVPVTFFKKFTRFESTATIHNGVDEQYPLPS